jgi:hypothetical protein
LLFTPLRIIVAVRCSKGDWVLLGLELWVRV